MIVERWAISIMFFICSSKLVININVPYMYMVVHYDIYVQCIYENQVVRMSFINVFIVTMLSGSLELK